MRDWEINLLRRSVAPYARRDQYLTRVSSAVVVEVVEAASDGGDDEVDRVVMNAGGNPRDKSAIIESAHTGPSVGFAPRHLGTQRCCVAQARMNVS